MQVIQDRAMAIPCLSHSESLLQAISSFSPLAGWQETQTLSQPPATAAAATSAAPATSRGPSGSAAAATSAGPVAGGYASLQEASLGHMQQKPPPTGQMLPPPTWMPTAPVGSSTAAGNKELAPRRYPGQNGPSQGVSKLGQHRLVGMSHRGACLAAGAVLLGCGLLCHSNVSTPSESR